MLKWIQTVDDSATDLEPALNALEKSRLASGVAMTRDGAQNADYLFKRGADGGRSARNPAGVLLDLELPKIFWAVLTESPPGSLRVRRNG